MARLARFWDSLENDRFFDISVSPPRGKKASDRWLSSLALQRDDEKQTILYAKPLLNSDDEPTHFHDPFYFGAQRINVAQKTSMLSSSLGNLSAPPKPQRRIARLRASPNTVTASVPQLGDVTSYSTMDLLDACKSSVTLCSVEEESNGDDSTIPEIARVRNLKLPGFVASSTPSQSSRPNRGRLPSYEQVVVARRNSQLRSGGCGIVPPSPQSTRHKISVNGTSSREKQRNEDVPTTIMSPPQSSRSDSTTSVDSGQCSGEILCEQRSLGRQESRESRDDEALPSYARMASTMDHVLRTSSALYTLLSTTLNTTLLRDLLAKTSVFIQLVESSPCSSFLPKSDIASLKAHLSEIQEFGKDPKSDVSNYFVIVLRKTVEQVLQIFVRIISKYLCECSSKDRLVSISLEHLIHVCLFGDELCIEAIQRSAISSCLRLARQPSTPEPSLRFLLRALAVLCGVSKGALQLLSNGGLELVLHHLLSPSSAQCSVECAGILTQLTNPQTSLVRLSNIHPIIRRLLDLIDSCSTGDSLLLVCAALNNVCLQHPSAVDLLYRENSIQRLISAYNRENCSTIFVQEQIVTCLSRLAARRYEQSLVANRAVPVLLEMLSLTHPVHIDYCRRIRYKAAVCIGTLANTDVGLKALYENQAYAVLSNVLSEEESVSNPFHMICANIRHRLEQKYQAESAV